MTSINLGQTIRDLRKARGLTQEGLATALSVTPQAVSKWESNTSYPEMTMIPMIAGFFEVSLDTLFDYDLRKVKTHIQKLLEDAEKYFFDDHPRYVSTIQSALADNPGNEDLQCALLDAYEWGIRNNGETEHLDEMIDLCHRIISTSRDFVKVCNVKDNLAAAYLQQGKYQQAKDVLESLPRTVCLRDDSMSFRLAGQDKIDAAVRAQHIALQDLYCACWQEGDGYYAFGKYQDALAAYDRGLATLTAFVRTNATGQDAYLWDGMQTFHYGFVLKRAGCLKKLGHTDGVSNEVMRAYEIISTSWKDFQEQTDLYMENFYDTLREFDLDAVFAAR